MFNAKIILWIRRSALLLLQVFLVLGCSSQPTPTDGPIILPPTSSPTSTPTPDQTPVPTLEVTETIIPSPTLTPFVPKAVIKIFSHVPVSGDQAKDGQEILHGSELAVQQLSGPLNEYSYKVELVSYDDQNLVEAALTNAQGIVADPEILCGVGHYDPDITVATSDIYHGAGLGIVAPAVTAPLLTQRNYLEVNRLVGRADWQGLAAAQFVKEQGFNSVFIIGQRSENSIGNAEQFRIESGLLGIKRLGSKIEAVTEENIAEVVSQIVSLNPELVYISSAAGQAFPLLTQLRDAGYMGTFFGTERLDRRSAIEAAGPSLTEGGGFYYTIITPPLNYFPNATKFVQDFEAQYDSAPSSLAARAYDATGVCLKAIEEASRAKDGALPTRAEVARAIRALKDYEGITETYNFNNNGDRDPAQYYVYQVTSVDPALWDQNKVVASYEITPPK